jgi:hypothetical protein
MMEWMQKVARTRTTEFTDLLTWWRQRGSIPVEDDGVANIPPDGSTTATQGSL